MQRQTTPGGRYSAIGLHGRITDALNDLDEEGPIRLLAQYPGIAESSVFNSVCRYLQEMTGADWVWIGAGGRYVVAQQAGTGVKVELPDSVQEWLSDARDYRGFREWLEDMRGGRPGVTP